MLVCFSIIFSSEQIDRNFNKTIIPGQEYYTDIEGNVYMFINILGHVKKPGTYMIYDGADVLTMLAQAGGPIEGANLKKTKIYKNGEIVQEVNLEQLLESDEIFDLGIKPNDTIFIQQSTISYLLTKANLLNSVLNILNLYIQISRL